MDVFSTPLTRDDGSERPPDDFQPRTRLKHLYSKGLVSSKNVEKLDELSKKLCVKKEILKGAILHLEQQRTLASMRERKRMKEREQHAEKKFDEYDWDALVRNGDISKLKVKELDKYLSNYEIPAVAGMHKILSRQC